MTAHSRPAKAPSTAPDPSGLPTPPPGLPTQPRGGQGPCQRTYPNDPLTAEDPCEDCGRDQRKHELPTSEPCSVCAGWACGQAGGWAGLPDLVEAEAELFVRYPDLAGVEAELFVRYPDLVEAE